MPEIEYMWDELSDNVAAEYENGVLAVGYTHEPGRYGNLLSHNRNGVTSYYHYDGRGDTVALTDDSGSVTDTKEYDAWGNVIASTGSTVTPYGLGGRVGYYWNADLQCSYIRSRMFQPLLARWTSTDPMGFVDGMNLYGFVKNRILLLLDPSGTHPCCCCCAFGLDYEQIRLGKYWPAGEERPQGNPAPFGRWPLEFRVNARLEEVPGNAEGDSRCDFEWFECSGQGGNRGQKPGEWSRFRPESGIDNSGDDPPGTCPAFYRRYIGDAPTIQDSTDSFTAINFVVRLKSSVLCPCAVNELTLTFHLVVEVVKADPLNPGKPPIFKPDPPILKNGLEAQIRGCGLTELATKFGVSPKVEWRP